MSSHMVIAGVRSAATTFGHRISGQPANLSGRSDRLRRDAAPEPVLAEVGERRTTIEELLTREASRSRGACPLRRDTAGTSRQGDPELLAEVAHLIEWPTVDLRGVRPSFLELAGRGPGSRAMRHHQKYFSLRDGSGKLLNRVPGGRRHDGGSNRRIRRGNEWVLRARLADAGSSGGRSEDAPLATAHGLLERITFHERLGSFAAKIRRMTASPRRSFDPRRPEAGPGLQAGADRHRPLQERPDDSARQRVPGAGRDRRGLYAEAERSSGGRLQGESARTTCRGAPRNGLPVSS